MSQVSVESIEAAILKIDALSDDALDRLIETFTLKQEHLVDYLLQAGLEYENDDLNMFSIYYFTIVYEAFNQQGLTIGEISEDAIDDFQEPFLLALDAIYKDEDYEPMQDLIRQHHLEQFILNEIDAPDEDGEELPEETRTQLFIVTSGMIALLNQAIIKA